MVNLFIKLKFTFSQMVQLTLGQNSRINVHSIFTLLACFTVAIFTAISGAAFNTNAITGTVGEPVNNLMDIVRLDKIPVFIEGTSLYDYFQEGVGKEFKAVYDQAKKYKMDKQISKGSKDAPKYLTEYNCIKGVIITVMLDINLAAKTVESICSQASKRRLSLHISPAFHTIGVRSLINPGTNETIGKELIRRDGKL